MRLDLAKYHLKERKKLLNPDSRWLIVVDLAGGLVSIILWDIVDVINRRRAAGERLRWRLIVYIR